MDEMKAITADHGSVVSRKTVADVNMPKKEDSVVAQWNFADIQGSDEIAVSEDTAATTENTADYCPRCRLAVSSQLAESSAGYNQHGDEGTSPRLVTRVTIKGVEMSRMMEGMPRYPNWSVMGVCRAIDYAGTNIFAVSGAIAAATSGMNFLGSTVVGCLTALAGGAIRDCLWGKAPVFWLDETEYLYMSALSAASAFVFCSLTDPSHLLLQRVLFWGDTFGLAAFSVISTMYAARMGYSYVVVMFCVLISCTTGGVVRDVLLRRPARVLHAHAEVYAETALVGGTAYMLSKALGLPLQYNAICGMITCFFLRVYASFNDVRMWTLTQYLKPES